LAPKLPESASPSSSVAIDEPEVLLVLLVKGSDCVKVGVTVKVPVALLPGERLLM
jgi:hypothetical protein